MERLLVIGCPDLMEPDATAPGPAEEGGPGHRLRRMAALVEALTEVCPWIDAVRPGVLALPVRGPARYFGGEAAVRERVRQIVATVLGGQPAVLDGVAEGVFAASLAALVQVAVPVGGTPAFLAPWPVATLDDPDLAELLVRLGLPTLGAFAALPAREVLGRLGREGAAGHRLARGQEGERPGYRVPGLAGQLASLRWHVPLANHQPGFWGGSSQADERAAEALVALQRQLGPEAVVVASLVGGRGPADRIRFVPWRADRPVPDATGTDRGNGAGGKRDGRKAAGDTPGPWPGRLPPPAPARVPATGPPVEVVDRTGAPVVVTGRGVLTAPPARVSVAGERWVAVVGWSAPWPVEEGWWSRAARRSARLQVVTADGQAHLLLSRHGGWRLEASYD